MVTIYKTLEQMIGAAGQEKRLNGNWEFICINGPSVLLWQQQEAEGMDHFNVRDYGRHKFL